MTKYKAVQTQTGVGLIEIMIAMVLGLFLAAGFFQIMTSSKQTYKTQSALARLQADARFALQTINEHLRLAGARSSSITDKAEAFPRMPPVNLPVPLTFGAEQILTGANNNNVTNDGVLDGTDVIAIRYQGGMNNTTRNCLGNTVAANASTVDIYYISDALKLRCRSGNQDQPLVDGVENLQIQYGMAANFNPGNPQASCYLDASTTQEGSGLACNALNFEQVVSVKLGLLLHTTGDDGKRLRTDDDTATYSLGGVNNITARDKSDMLLRRAFSTTVSLRNRLK